MMAILLTVLNFVASSFSSRVMYFMIACHLPSPLCLVPFGFFYVILVTAVFEIL